MRGADRCRAPKVSGLANQDGYATDARFFGKASMSYPFINRWRMPETGRQWILGKRDMILCYHRF